jgi:two-component system chemotaxis response regulator CheY
MILSGLLASFGYTVVGQARNTQESIEKYQDLKPDLVVMDVAIPDADGVSAIRRLLYIDETANIIVSVSNGQRSLAMEALSAGAKDFITKPINPRSLQKVLRSASS